jgi:hypothetical protein
MSSFFSRLVMLKPPGGDSHFMDIMSPECEEEKASSRYYFLMLLLTSYFFTVKIKGKSPLNPTISIDTRGLQRDVVYLG